MSGALSTHWWRRSEIDLLTREYPRGGAKHVARLLPHRTPIAIHTRAGLLGLKRPGGRGRRRNV